MIAVAKMIRALKSCRFTGKDYSVGDRVPEAAVDKKMIGALVRMKLITVVDEPPPAPKPKSKARTADKKPAQLLETSYAIC